METTPSSSSQFFPDSLAAFAHLRQHAPVEKFNMNGQDAWLITRFTDVVAVLKDPRFSLRPTRKDNPQSLRISGPLATSPHLLSTDGLDHRRLRDLVSKGFTPRFVEGRRLAVRQLADELLDAIEASGQREFDLIDAFAFPLPINVIANMLGLPREDYAKLRAWSDSIFGDIGVGDNSNQAEMDAFTDYLRHLFDHKRQQPGDDLISALVRVEADSDALTEQELIAMVMLLIFAGHETTVNLLGNGMLALLTHPTELATLRAQPELMESAVEELLRLEGPATMPGPRFALEDMQLGDHLIRAGEMVVVSLTSANHDETQFSHADELDIARTLNKHVAFGQGAHYCLGAPLARMEAQEALAVLFHRFPHLALNADPSTLRWRVNPALRGLHALPLKY